MIDRKFELLFIGLAIVGVLVATMVAIAIVGAIVLLCTVPFFGWDIGLKIVAVMYIPWLIWTVANQVIARLRKARK